MHQRRGRPLACTKHQPKVTVNDKHEDSLQEERYFIETLSEEYLTSADFQVAVKECFYLLLYYEKNLQYENNGCVTIYGLRLDNCNIENSRMNPAVRLSGYFSKKENLSTQYLLK